MPFDNAYNRENKKNLQKIIDNMMENDKRNNELFVPTFFSQYGNPSQIVKGGAIPKNFYDAVKYDISAGGNIKYGDAAPFGSRYNGGSGFAAASPQDMGEDWTNGVKGSGKKMGKGSKVYKKDTLKLVRDVEGGAKRKRGRPSKKMLEGGNWLSDFGKGFMSVVNPVLSIAKPILKTIPSPYTQTAAGILDAVGAGKKRRGRPSKKMLEGGATLGLPKSLVGSGITDTVERVIGGKRRGRPTKMSAGRKLIPVANLPASQMTAGAKPKRTNKRAELVKKIMKEQNLSMIKASSYVKDHKLYNP